MTGLRQQEPEPCRRRATLPRCPRYHSPYVGAPSRSFARTFRAGENNGGATQRTLHISRDPSHSEPMAIAGPPASLTPRGGGPSAQTQHNNSPGASWHPPLRLPTQAFNIRSLPRGAHDLNRWELASRRAASRAPANAHTPPQSVIPDPHGGKPSSSPLEHSSSPLNAHGVRQRRPVLAARAARPHAPATMPVARPGTNDLPHWA